MPSRSRNAKGFTLIELLIVVVIIGLLAAIALPKFAATKDKSKLASVRSDLRNVMSAQEAYYVDYGVYSPTLNPTVFVPTQPNQMSMSVGTAGFTATITNPTISSGFTGCTVEVGSGTTQDSQIICS